MRNSIFYTALPLNLIYDEKYKGLSANSILLYSLILNRFKLSSSNEKYQDEKGAFVHYSTPQICEHLRCCRSTAKKAIQELETAKLIESELEQSGLPLKIYVNDIFGNQKPTYTKPTPQDKPAQRAKSSYKPPAVNRETSFDMSLTDQMTSNHLMSFAEKKKKRKSH